MAHTITHFSPEIRRRIDGFLMRFGDGMNAYLDAHSRRDRIEALEAKSDEELAAMGLRRDQITRHVFRDMVWI